MAAVATVTVVVVVARLFFLLELLDLQSGSSDIVYLSHSWIWNAVRQILFIFRIPDVVTGVRQILFFLSHSSIWKAVRLGTPLVLDTAGSNAYPAYAPPLLILFKES